MWTIRKDKMLSLVSVRKLSLSEFLPLKMMKYKDIVIVVLF